MFLVLILVLLFDIFLNERSSFQNKEIVINDIFQIDDMIFCVDDEKI